MWSLIYSFIYIYIYIITCELIPCQSISKSNTYIPDSVNPKRNWTFISYIQNHGQEKQAGSATELWDESVSFYTSAAPNCFVRVITTWRKEPRKLASKDFAISSCLNTTCLSSRFMSVDTISLSAWGVGASCLHLQALEAQLLCETFPKLFHQQFEQGVGGSEMRRRKNKLLYFRTVWR